MTWPAHGRKYEIYRRGRAYSLHKPVRRPLYLDPDYIYLDPDDWDFVERLRHSGTLGASFGADPWHCDLTLSLSGGEQKLYSGGDMRRLEERSREANRQNSTWFNDDMMDYWRDRWAEIDERKKGGWQYTAKIELERLHSIVVDPEEREVLEEEWVKWQRDKRREDRRRKKEQARYEREQVEWDQWEAAKKQQRMQEARSQREAVENEERERVRAIRRTHKAILDLAHHVNRTTGNKGHRRHQRENVGSLETA